MFNKSPLLLSLCGAAILLSGCNSVRNTLGLDHYQADEFSVPKTPPLSMPPNFDLVPPKPGAAGPNVTSPEEKAQLNLLGTKVKGTTASPSQTEQTLKKEAAKQASKEEDIRNKINKEAVNEGDTVDRSKPFLDRVADTFKGENNEAPAPSLTTTKPFNPKQ